MNVSESVWYGNYIYNLYILANNIITPYKNSLSTLYIIGQYRSILRHLGALYTYIYNNNDKLKTNEKLNEGE